MNVLEDDADLTGFSKRRLRSTKAVEFHEFDMIFNMAEWETFRAWVQTNLAGGALSFIFPHPLTKISTEMEFILSDGTAYELVRFTPKDSVRVHIKTQEV
jgi:hypothetical protein